MQVGFRRDQLTNKQNHRLNTVWVYFISVSVKLLRGFKFKVNKQFGAIFEWFLCHSHVCLFVFHAGVWATKLGQMAGVKVPLVAMHHAYVVTERIEGIQVGCCTCCSSSTSLWFHDMLYRKCDQSITEVDPDYTSY